LPDPDEPPDLPDLPLELELEEEEESDQPPCQEEAETAVVSVTRAMADFIIINLQLIDVYSN